MRVALAQMNPTVGDLEGNTRKILEFLHLAAQSGAELAVFTELAVTGYPPEDLLLKPSFIRDAEASLDRIRRSAPPLVACIGLPRQGPPGLRNSAAILYGGRRIDHFDKGTLPNYGVFDEKRYFRPSIRCPVYQWGALRLGVNICEDLWVTGGLPRVQVRKGRAQLLVNLSASPFHHGKGELRDRLLQHRARQYGVPIISVNQVGGQDELVFDGRSVVISATGEILARAKIFEEDLLLFDLRVPPPSPGAPAPRDEDFRQPMTERLEYLEEHLYLDPVAFPEEIPPPSPLGDGVGRIESVPGDDEMLYRALLLGLRDYVRKNRFERVVVGLSGGADSALTVTLAADALGPEAVTALAMPSPYTSEASLRDARELARRLGIRLDVIPIHEVFRSYRAALEPAFKGLPEDVTEENLQARIRGNLLMAYSNKFGALVLTTGNKSELAVGYCTLYGDMAGGFAVLMDVLKTRVYQLIRWRNAQRGEVIPRSIIERAPSAELRPGQTDQDALPPYEVLDPILELIVEEDLSPSEIVAAGYDPATVLQIFKWVQGNEYKRRQAPPGVKLTPRAFGKDRRYPLTNRYEPRIQQG